MSNASVTTPRRGALVGALRAVPALMGAAIVAGPLTASAAEPDPIFAAIDEHKALDAWTNERGTDEDEVERRTAIADKKRDELIEIAPTTLAGACALLMHIVETAALFIEDDTPSMRAVRNVEKALPGIRAKA
jgi:hypothetical protein